MGDRQKFAAGFDSPGLIHSRWIMEASARRAIALKTLADSTRRAICERPAATATHCGISFPAGSKQLWRVKTQFSRDARSRLPTGERWRKS
jgi:hypothetical protein